MSNPGKNKEKQKKRAKRARMSPADAQLMSICKEIMAPSFLDPIRAVKLPSGETIYVLDPEAVAAAWRNPCPELLALGALADALAAATKNEGT